MDVAYPEPSLLVCTSVGGVVVVGATGTSVVGVLTRRRLPPSIALSPYRAKVSGCVLLMGGLMDALPLVGSVVCSLGCS